VTKCAPKKLKLKNEKMALSKIRKQFFNFNFFGGHFDTGRSLLFGNQHKILDYLIPNMTYSRKKISPLRRAIFQILRHKNPQMIEMPQI
jgi:hypothetical protein